MSDLISYSDAGYDGSSLVPCWDYPRVAGSGKSTTFKWDWWCLAQKAFPVDEGGVIPVYKTKLSASPFGMPGLSDFVMTDYSLQDAESPDCVVVSFAFEDLSSSSASGWVADKPPEKRQRTIPLAVPLTVLYNLEGDAEYLAAIERGEKTRNIWGLEYQIVYYYDADLFVWSEKNMAKSGSIEMGKVTPPTGVTGATDQHWMYKGNDIAENDGIVRVTENWIYTSKPGCFP